MTTTPPITTPYDAEIAKLYAFHQAGYLPTIRRLEALAEGYRRAKAEDALLLAEEKP